MERVVLLKICMSKQFLETLFYFVNGWLRFLLPRRRLSATDVRSSYDPFSPATAPPFLGPKLLGLRIVPSLGLLSLSGSRQLHSALSSDNSQIHLWLENAVWPILEL